MKYLVPLFVLLFFTLNSYSQNPYPINQTMGSNKTLVTVKGGIKADSSLVIPVFPDTSTANANPYAGYYAGNLMRVGNTIYIRSADTTRWIPIANNGGVSNEFFGTQLVSGDAIWSSGLTFNVTNCTYYILGDFYSSLADVVTLDPADPTFGRIDVIYLDTLGNVGVITGIPSPNPSKPVVDPISQIELTHINISTNATTPDGISSKLVYNENVQLPNEWNTFTDDVVNIDLAYTINPYSGTKSILLKELSKSKYLTFTNSGDVSKDTSKFLNFYLRINSAIPPSGSGTGTGIGTPIARALLNIELYRAGSPVTNVVQVVDGAFGLSFADSLTYQNIAIDFENFIFSTTSNLFDEIRITSRFMPKLGIQIDFVRIQKGGFNPPVISDAWVLKGNDVTTYTEPRLGTTSASELNIITNDLSRVVIDKDGAFYEKSLQDFTTTDTTNKYLILANNTGLHERILAGSLNNKDTVFVKAPLFVTSGVRDTLSANVVDSIWRVQGVDSIYFRKNNVNYAIKDSIGSGGGGSYTFQNGLTEAGGVVELGGILTQVDTYIDGNAINSNALRIGDNTPIGLIRIRSSEFDLVTNSGVINSNNNYLYLSSNDSITIASGGYLREPGLSNYRTTDTTGKYVMLATENGIHYTYPVTDFVNLSNGGSTGVDSIWRVSGKDSIFWRRNSNTFAIKDSIGSVGASGILHGTASGTDTYTVTLSGVSSYADGDNYLVRFPNGNTTSATLNVNGLGAKNLYRNNDGLVIGGDIEDGSEMLCVYNTTLNGFQLIGTSPNSLIAYVTNADTGTLTKGQVVYAFGGQGDRLTVKRANNKTDVTSAQTVGLVMSSSIGVNQKGFIMMQGLLDNLSILPTSTWADGDAVYLDSISGGITKTKPSAPYHLVYIGYVTTASNGNSGRLYVRVQNGYELQELHNVSIINPVNNNVLAYSDTQALWKNRNIYSIVDTTTIVATKSNVALKVNISDTANMLNPYLRKVDTTSLSNRINTKLNITDTTVFSRKSIAAYSFRANNTNATADLATFTFRQTGTLTLPDSLITWTGTTAPSGSTNHTYEWQQIGNKIEYQFILSYGTAGTSNTTVQIKKPDDMPAVKQKSGQTAANSLLGRGVGQQSATKTSTTSPTGTITSLKRNAGNTADEFVLTTAATNTSFVIIQGTYFTD